jgi:hypothetical protein
MNIFVAGLPYDLDDAELMEIFGKKPLVVKAAEDRPSGGGGQNRNRPSGPSGGGFDRRPPRRF